MRERLGGFAEGLIGLVGMTAWAALVGALAILGGLLLFTGWWPLALVPAAACLWLVGAWDR